jgi:hypothetical protein
VKIVGLQKQASNEVARKESVSSQYRPKIYCWEGARFHRFLIFQSKFNCGRALGKTSSAIAGLR